MLTRITTNNCKHLIIDAGHIAIESDLVDKAAIRTIHQKRNQKYTDEDYRNLESLMYDKLSLRLDDAQVRFNYKVIEIFANDHTIPSLLSVTIYSPVGKPC